MRGSPRRVGSFLAVASAAGLLVLGPQAAPAGAAAGPPTTFAPYVGYPTDAYPAAVASGDVDEDGTVDLVATGNHFSPSVSVLLGDGAGAFEPFTATPVAGVDPREIALLDVDGDSHLDAVTVNFGSSDVSVLPGDGTGQFGPSTQYDTGGNPWALAVGDLDGDSRLDLVTGNAASDSVSVLLAVGDGTFAPRVDYATIVGPRSVAVRDLDGDGFADLAVAGGGAGRVSVLLGNGDGTFAPHTVVAETSGTAGSVAVADLNGDAFPDLAVTAGRVELLFGNGDGTFAAGGTIHPVVNCQCEVAVADLNGDTIDDLAVAGTGTPSGVSVLHGNGDGTLAPPTTHWVGGAVVGVTIADLNGDARPDLAAAAAGSQVSVLLNRPGLPQAPTIGTATSGVLSATVSWTAPASEGASPITGYVVTPYLGFVAGTPITFESTVTTQVVTGLTPGAQYRFRVQAINSVGTGQLSAVSNAVQMPVAPGAPTMGTVVPGNAKARVAWTAPASNGGSPVTGYVVTPYVGGVAQTPVTFTTASTVQTITGLTNGTAYRFRVAAVNAVGTGPQSVLSSSVTPAAVPGAPTMGAVVPGNAKARVAWTAPASNGGSPVTGYVVTPYVGGVAQTPVTFTTASTVQAITGLTNGTAYRFRVAAVNGVGTGAPSVLSNAVTPTGA